MKNQFTSESCGDSGVSDARQPPVLAPVRHTVSCLLRDDERVLLQTIRLGSDDYITVFNGLYHSKSDAVKGWPCVALVVHVTGRVSVTRTQQQCVAANSKSDVVGCQRMCDAFGIDDGNLNESNVAAVADERVVCMRRNLEHESLRRRCCAHAGVGHDGTGIVECDGAKFAFESVSGWFMGCGVCGLHSQGGS